MPDIFVAPNDEKKPEEKPANNNEPVIPPDAKQINQSPQPVDEIKANHKVIPESRGGSLSAFITYPETIHFDTQENKEQIILFLRKHWITNIPWLFITFMLIMAPTIIFPMIAQNGLFGSIPPKFIFIITLVWYLATFGFALVNFISWYFNVYIVTNERVIDVDFYQLLFKQMSSARISRVQDLTYKLGGVIRAIFDFGDVFVQTAGEEPNFDFEAVPHPEQVVRIIGNLTEHEEQPV